MSEVDAKIDVVYICRVALKSEEMDFEDLTCYFRFTHLPCDKTYKYILSIISNC
jgi:hypothetical protein